MASSRAAITALLLAVSGVSMAGVQDPDTMHASEDAVRELRDSAWQVEDIDGRGIVDRSMITLTFTDEGRIAGSTGCNRYFGHVYLDGDVITISGTGSTRRACVPALMDQEQRFLAALGAAARHERDEAGRLVIFDGAGARRLVAVSIEIDPTTESG